MRRRFALLLLLSVAPAFGLDFRSISEPAILYDAPASKARRLFVIARYTPVEVVVSLDAWVKVRNNRGDLAWVSAQAVSPLRTVMVRVDRAQVFAQPDEKSARVFEAERDVALELVEAAPPGWAKVRHRDGQAGFVKVSQVWGV